jgi:hypothetical protein
MVSSFNEVLPLELGLRLPITGLKGESILFVQIPLAAESLDLAGFNAEDDARYVRVAYDFAAGRALLVHPDTDFVEPAAAGAWQFDPAGTLSLLAAEADGSGGYDVVDEDPAATDIRYLLKLDGGRLNDVPVTYSYDVPMARAILAKVSGKDLKAFAEKVLEGLVLAAGGSPTQQYPQTSEGIDLSITAPLSYRGRTRFRLAWDLDESVVEGAGFDVDYAGASVIFDFSSGRAEELNLHPGLVAADAAVPYLDGSKRVETVEGDVIWSADGRDCEGTLDLDVKLFDRVVRAVHGRARDFNKDDA